MDCVDHHLLFLWGCLPVHPSIPLELIWAIKLLYCCCEFVIWELKSWLWYPVPKTHVNTYVLLHRKLQSMQAYIFLKKIKIEHLCLHIQLEPTLSHTHCNRRGPYLTIGASIKPIGMQQNRNVHSCPMMLIMLGNWPWNPVCAMQCSCLGVQKPWI